MTNIRPEEPELMFFRDTPRGLTDRPPLASSLQGLETSFLLVAMGRYPHALVTCGSAIESAIKAAIHANLDDRFDFRDLMDEARRKSPSFTTLSEDETREFRFKRNEIAHYGFSPRDDVLCAALLLKTGYTLIEQCYEGFFQFSLLGQGDTYGGLLPGLAYHLNLARRVYGKARQLKDINLANCFISFAHWIRMSIYESMMPEWEAELDGGFAAWESREKKKGKYYDRILDPAWVFDCPLCHEVQCLVAELDFDKLKKHEVSLNGVVCVNCDLMIPNDFPFLADELCAEQFDKELPKMLKDFGIK